MVSHNSDPARDNPSLKPYLREALPETYEDGKDLTVRETNLLFKTFPQTCAYTLEEITGDRFYPGVSVNLEEF